ncbi:hypothetical protein PMAYCL1PPCAC_02246 [Pristionchus mayeri]|uniref:Divalent-cation tolerance protein CutA n=1 Tax=Pristionchus mayeri TaxID=1317129 RepID=A0AAN4Z3S3_9BILA|nr:hypothetical protein PMAYCL1PPCAC_02246 [Pristionchus mayeri]
MKRETGYILALSSLIAIVSLLSGQMLKMAALRVVFITTPSEEVATKLARAVVEQKLAACVNIVPGIKSIYEWEGKIHEDAEHLMIVKTVEESVPSLREKILSIHPYDTPEFISLPVSEESEKYAEWVRTQSAKTTVSPPQ